MKKLLLSFAFALVATMGFSQSSLTHNVKIKINNVMELKRDTTSGSSLTDTLSFTTGENLEDGVTSTEPLVMFVRSNRDWVVSVRAASENFGFTATNTGDADPAMPATMLQYKEESAADWTALSYEPQSTSEQLINGVLTTVLGDYPDGTSVKTGSRGGWGVAGNKISMRYKAVPDFDYPAGIYAMDVVYTLSPN